MRKRFYVYMGTAWSYQGLHYPQTESLDTTECMSGEQRPGYYFAHAQDDLNLHVLRKYEGNFSFSAQNQPHCLSLCFGEYFS